jgi:hypothetical protein
MMLMLLVVDFYMFLYGEGNEDLFSIQLDHNGFFCGLWGEFTYENETKFFFDNCGVEHSQLYGLWILF